MSNASAVVFLGPSLPATEAEQLFPEAELCPPAARGDVLRAALRGPRLIALIDGYFEHRLAVQHKELLWALKQGCSVYGAASMGALRAAELVEYGMVGSGAIYQAFADGELEGDDEVAVTHGPAPEYRVGSEPLVDIRATLLSASAEGYLDPELAVRLIGLAQAQFYPDRSYPTLLGMARTEVMDLGVWARLQAWLAEPSNHVKQKRRDAIELLATARGALLAGTLPGAPSDWAFPWTSAWNQLWQEVTGSPR